MLWRESEEEAELRRFRLPVNLLLRQVVQAAPLPQLNLKLPGGGNTEAPS